MMTVAYCNDFLTEYQNYVFDFTLFTYSEVSSATASEMEMQSM